MNRNDLLWPALQHLNTTAATIHKLTTHATTLTRYLTREYEHWTTYPLPLHKRLTAWRHGFMARDWVLLELDDNNPANYLSARQQAKHITPAVNPDYADILTNKLAFHRATHHDAIPTLYGTITNGTYHPEPNTPDTLLTLLDKHNDLIIKPTTGSQGRNITHLTTTDDGYHHNDTPTTPTKIQDHIQSRDHAIVTEHVTNHDYAHQIYPHATNTIRLLTIKNPDNNNFFIPSAIHRFGTTQTGPTDNWSGGGYAAPINTDTGHLQQLHTYTPDTGLQHHDTHPTTNTPVTNTHIPHWDQITTTAKQLANHHSPNPYIGWDIAPTPDGPIVLEGNPAPHLALQQLGGGLLEDDRVQTFLDTLAKPSNTKP